MPKKVVPDWMVHFSDRHKHGSGMTFVDLVFPGLSEMLPSPFGLIDFDAEPGLAWYVFCSAAWAVLLLTLTAGLNYRGIRLKL